MDALLPRRNAYAELLGGASVLGGPFIRAEAGKKINDNLALFGYGEARRDDASVGVGVRWTWDP